MGLKKISGKYVKFLIYFVVIVLVNAVGATLFFRVDLTENDIYSLSDASKRVVSTLSEPLTVNVFFTRNLPAPYNSIERYLRDLLEEYAAYANTHFNFRFYDVSPEEGDVHRETRENQELAGDFGIRPVQIQAFEEDEVKFQKVYMGLVLIHGDVIDRIPTITSTDRLEYRLTTAMSRLNNKVSALLSLQGKIHVKLFLSSSLERVAPFMGLRPLMGIPEKIEDIVKKLNEKHYGKLEFEYFDPSVDKRLEDTSKEYRILSLKWPALSDGKIEPGVGVIGLVMAHGEKVVSVPLLNVVKIPIIGTQYELTDMDRMEEVMEESIGSLIDINENIGFLASHGTLDVQGLAPSDPARQRTPDNVNNLRTLISENYTIKPVDLKKGGIPSGLKCLVIPRPTEPFSEYELFQIDQFLMQGKNLALFPDAFNEVMPTAQGGMQPGGAREPGYVPLDTGLEKLLAHYGVTFRRSYVMDESCYKQRLPSQFGGGEQNIFFAPVIKSHNIDKTLGFMKRIQGLIALKISPLSPDEQRIKAGGLTARTLFSSSDKSWEMHEPINLNPMFISPPKSEDEMRKLPMACILSGEFSSYFSGKPIPEKEPAEGDETEADLAEPSERQPDADLSKIKGEGVFLSKGKPGKIFLMASSDMLTDTILDTDGNSPNAMYILNLLDYLNDREDIAVMRSKEQRFNPLMDTGAGVKTIVKSFNIAGLPVLVVLFGFAVWFRRHSRKKQIRIMFIGVRKHP